MLLGIKFYKWPAYKAQVITVDPSHTTRRRSICGSIPEKRIDLDVRIYACSNCGLIIDRDYNATLIF